MESSAKRVRGLVRLGWDLLEAGRSREAGQAFGRVLLRSPSHAEARRGLDQARAAAAEAGRDLEARLDEASTAVDSGGSQRARALLEAMVTQGVDAGRVLSLLDRLDTREGRIYARPARNADPSASTAPVAARRPAWSRRVLLAGWSVVFGSTAAGVAASWDRLVGGLVKPPVPASGPAPTVTEIPSSSPGERALQQARRLIEQGDPAGAVVALDHVPADDPAYPFALRLRVEAQAALGSGPRR